MHIQSLYILTVSLYEKERKKNLYQVESYHLPGKKKQWIIVTIAADIFIKKKILKYLLGKKK
jgi:hypothetical protein